MNFKIKETNYSDEKKTIEETYKKVKKDYLNKVSINDIRKKYNISVNQWYNVFLKLLEEDNLNYSSLNRKYKRETGVKYVSKIKHKKGFVYHYHPSKNFPYYVSGVSLNRLKKKVLKYGLEWVVTNETKAKEEGLSI